MTDTEYTPAAAASSASTAPPGIVSSRQLSRGTRLARARHQDVLAIDANAVGFSAWVFTQVNLPHRRPTDPQRRLYWERRLGTAFLGVEAGRARPRRSGVGFERLEVPAGGLPRLVTAHLCTAAIRSDSPEVELPPSQAGMLSALFPGDLAGLPIARQWEFGGAQYRRFRRRFLEVATAHYYVGLDQRPDAEYMLTTERAIWWDDEVDAGGLPFPCHVRLSEAFWRDLQRAPIPFDQRTFTSLAGSTVAQDVYLWLAFRLPRLTEPTLISWAATKDQFGPEYARERDFRRYFAKPLREALFAYPDAKVEVRDEGLVLRPSPPHVAARSRLWGRRRANPQTGSR
ncbi:MAG: replication protein RepA [Acidimicrobiales bacterium]